MEVKKFMKQNILNEIEIAVEFPGTIVSEITNKEFDKAQKGPRKKEFLVPSEQAKFQFHSLANGLIQRFITKEEYFTLLEIFLKKIFPLLSESRVNKEANKHYNALKKMYSI